MPKHHGHSEAAAVLSLGAVAGAVGGAYKMAEFLVHAKKLGEVGHEHAGFVRLLASVRADVRETERLLHLREAHDALATNPAKVRWIRDTVARVRAVLEEMGHHTERVGGDLERRKWGWFGGAHVGFRHRLRWVLDEHEKLLHRTAELAMAHQSLVAVMGFLSQFEPLACCDREKGSSVRIDVEREVFDERDGQSEEFEEKDREFVEVRRRSDDHYDEKDREYVQVRRRSTDHHHDGKDREYVQVRRRSAHAREERDRAFVEGSEDKIILMDNEKDDPGYGYFGGDGPRVGGVKRRDGAVEVDAYRTKKVYEFDEPDNRTVYREKKVYDYDLRDRDREAEVVREKRVYRERPGREEKTVIRERREYESDRPRRSHWTSSRL